MSSRQTCIYCRKTVDSKERKHACKAVLRVIYAKARLTEDPLQEVGVPAAVVIKLVDSYANMTAVGTAFLLIGLFGGVGAWIKYDGGVALLALAGLCVFSLFFWIISAMVRVRKERRNADD